MRSNEELRTEMYGIIDRWERSGLNQKEFCKAEDISYHKFKYWKKHQGREQAKPPKPDADFVPVSVVGSVNNLSDLELSFPNGVKLKCSADTPAFRLYELIKLF